MAEEGIDEDRPGASSSCGASRSAARAREHGLSGDDLARTVELQGVLARIREALANKGESELR